MKSSRDLNHEFDYIDSDALAVCGSQSAIATADTHWCKQIISDPHYPVVLMRVRLEGG